MDTKTFIERVVPDDGVYFLATSYIKSDSTKGIRHKTLTTLDKIDQVIQYLNAKHQDVYIAIGSFNTNKSRTQKNVKSKKAFYLDLDCGPGKEFTGQKAAIKELLVFIKNSGMPQYSILTNSGNGIHAYWTLETPIPADEWLPLARALKRKCVEHGFKVDSTCTSDSARILRLPGTYNVKDEEHSKLCNVIGKDNGNVPLARLQKVLLATTTPILTSVPNTGALVDNSDLGEKREFQNPPAKQIFDRCLTFKHALDTGGEKDSQPLWAQILHVLAYLPDGRDYIHKVSDQHPGYDKDETEKKYAEKLQVVVNGSISGPTGCDTFALTGGSQCHRCPYYGQVKNPILTVFHKMPGELPNNYMMQDDGMYKAMQIEGEEDGVNEWVKFTPYKLFDATLNVPVGEYTHYLRFKYAIGNSTEAVAEIPCIDLPDAKSFNALLGWHNIAMQPEQMKGAQRLMVAWKQQMESAKHITHAPNRMGWTTIDKKIGFALAQKIIWEDGKETPNPLPSPELLKHYSPTGVVDEWKKAAQLIIHHPNIELSIALATSFAAPLMQMTNTHGAVLSIVSQASGIGKSKALHTAQSVWGKPNQINSMDDTANSMIRKMGILNNLPAYWDELHMNSGMEGVDEFTNMIFRLAQGKEKTRLTSAVNFQSSGEWTTLITVVSNDSIHDHLRLHRSGTDAAMMRVLELDIVDARLSNDPLAGALTTFGGLDTNYGVAGEIYSRYITKHHAQLKANVISTIAKLAGIANMGQSERMRIALIAAVLVGAAAANKAGLTDFDVSGIAKRMLVAIKPKVDTQGNVQRHNKTVWEMLSEYMDEYADSTNKTDLYQQRGTNLTTVISQPKTLPVRVHVADSIDRMRIEETHFRNWVTKNYGGGSRAVEWLKHEPNVTKCRANLAFGLKSSIKAKRTRLLETPIP